jgi:hypothetical protein
VVSRLVKEGDGKVIKKEKKERLATHPPDSLTHIRPNWHGSGAKLQRLHVAKISDILIDRMPPQTPTQTNTDQHQPAT